MKKTALTLAATLFAASAQAAIVVDNAGANPVCQVSEVQLPAGTNADYCLGYFDLGAANPTNEASFLNARTDGADWNFVYKTPGGGDNQQLFGGLSFSVTAAINQNSGLWTFSWADTNGSDPLNLPTILDIAFLFKAGENSAFFLFEDFLLTNNPFSSGGSFDLLVQQALSHESVFVRLGDTPPPPPPPGQIPEPATLVLVGLALAGLGLRRRKRAA